MKKIIYILMFLSPFCAFCANTVNECDLLLKSLQIERNRLVSLPSVVFRSKDDRKHNFSRRLGVVEVNRSYAPLDHTCSFSEFQKLTRQAIDYSNATNRIREIDEEISALKIERKRLKAQNRGVRSPEKIKK